MIIFFILRITSENITDIPYIYTYGLYFLNISEFLRTTRIPSSFLRHHRKLTLVKNEKCWTKIVRCYLHEKYSMQKLIIYVK